MFFVKSLRDLEKTSAWPHRSWMYSGRLFLKAEQTDPSPSREDGGGTRQRAEDMSTQEDDWTSRTPGDQGMMIRWFVFEFPTFPIKKQVLFYHILQKVSIPGIWLFTEKQNQTKKEQQAKTQEKDAKGLNVELLTVSSCRTCQGFQSAHYRMNVRLT